MWFSRTDDTLFEFVTLETIMPLVNICFQSDTRCAPSGLIVLEKMVL